VETGLIGAVLPPQQRGQWRIVGFYRLTIFWGCVSAIDSNDRTTWIADAYRVTMSPGISRTRCRSGCL